MLQVNFEPTAYITHQVRSKELYVEILEIDVRTIEYLEEYKLFIRIQCKKTSDKSISIFLPDNSTPDKIYEELKKKKLIDNDGDFRLFRIYLDQIVEEYSNNEYISNKKEFVYCVEKIDKDDIGQAGQHVRCVYFRLDSLGTHLEYYNEPFLFFFRKDEKLKDSCVRLAQKLGLSKSDLVGVKYAKVRKTEAVQFSDDTIIADERFYSSFHQYFFGIYLKEKVNQLKII